MSHFPYDGRHVRTIVRKTLKKHNCEASFKVGRKSYASETKLVVQFNNRKQEVPEEVIDQVQDEVRLWFEAHRGEVGYTKEYTLGGHRFTRPEPYSDIMVRPF